MKLLFIHALVFGIIFCSFAQEKTIVKGKIDGKAGHRIIVSAYKSLVDPQEQILAESITDRGGNFLLELDIDAITTVHIGSEGNRFKILLYPGEELSIGRKNGSWEFSGEAGLKNKIYKHLVSILYSPEFTYFGQPKPPVAKAFYHKLDSIFQYCLNYYSQYESMLQDNFGNYIKGFIIGNIYLQKELHATFENFKKNKDSSYEPDYYGRLNSYLNVGIEAFEKRGITAYHNYISQMLTRKAWESRLKVATGNINQETAEVWVFPAKYSIADTLFQDDDVREIVLTEILNDIVKNHKSLDTIKKYSSKHFNSFPDANYKNALRNRLYARMQLSKGNPAPDFVLKDQNGRNISLTDFRGKVVYIDFWFSACGPCIKEMPYSINLSEQFDQKEVVFLYVAVNDKAELWRNAIKRLGLQNKVNLFADKSQSTQILADYVFLGFPRYVLIDKEGNIYDSNAKRPSNPELVLDIQKLL